MRLNDALEGRPHKGPASAAAALSIRYKIPIITARMERIGGTKFRLVANPPPNLPSTGELNIVSGDGSGLI